MGQVEMRVGAAARMTDALLRSLGGCAAALRVPVNAVANQDAEQLGLSEPQFQDLPIGPAVYRRVEPTKADGKGERAELLVSATTVLGLAGMMEYESAAVLFAQAAGVLVDGRLMQIAGVTASEAFGRPYLYRLQLCGAMAEMI